MRPRFPAGLPAVLVLLLVACAPTEPWPEPSPSPTTSPIEAAWLEEHMADPCYADAVGAYRDGLAQIEASAEAFDALATAPSPPSDEDGQAAGESLARGSTGLQQAAALAVRARAACRSAS